MLRSRLSIGALGALVCIASLDGCARSSLSKGEQPQLDGSLYPGDDTTDETPPRPDAGGDMDSGRPDKAPLPDGSIIEDDAAVESDASIMDATVMVDSSHGEDAAEPGEDAEVIETDPLMCSEVPDAPHTQLGTPAAPIEHALADGLLQGEVDWRGRAFFRITGVTPGQGYLLVLTGDQLELAVFADEDVFGAVDCISGTTTVLFPAVCFVTAIESTLDLTVHAVSGVQPFELEIIPTAEPEGTKEAPLAIALADLPRVLATEPGQPSYYEITGVTPGTTYAVKGTPWSLTMRLGVFHPTFDSIVDFERTGRGAIVQAIGTSLLVAALGPATREPLTLDVVEVSYVSEGTREAPVVIAADELPYEGEISWAYNNDGVTSAGRADADSYYAITGLAPGDYTVSMSAGPALHLSVHGGEPIRDDVPAQCAVTPSLATDLECGAHVEGSTLYLRVSNHGGDGSPLALDLVPSAYSTEGSELAPLELTRSQLPHAGEALGSTDSNYRISGLTPGQAYLVRVGGPSSRGARLSVLDETAHNICEVGTDAGGAQCKVTPDGTSVLVRVGANFEAAGRTPGGSFMLDLIELDERPTSSFHYPIPIECTEGRAASTLSGSGSSFYRISDLEPGVRYVIEARSPGFSNMFVRSEVPHDPILCAASGSAALSARCLVAPPSSSVIVEVTGDAYGELIELTVRRPHEGSEGTADAPITVAIDQLPLAGRVATASPSYYAITGLTPGATYTLQIASAQEGVLVHPYGDLASSVQLDTVEAVPGWPGTIQFTAPTATLVLETVLLEPSDWVTDVSIDLLSE